MGAAVSLQPDDDYVLSQCLLFSRGEECELEPVDMTALNDDEGVGSGAHCVITADCISGGVTPSSLASLAAGLLHTSTSGLVLSNNNLDTGVFATLPPLSSLTYLHLGGNSALPLQDITVAFASAQNRVLDLGYTESLPQALSDAPFAACPQLVRLVLDGCGLESTLVGAGSLFTGLPSLRELSLKENLFGSVDSLRGLECLAASLRRLCLADNPVMEVSSQVAEIRGLLGQMPRLEILDDKSIRQQEPGEGKAVILSRVDGGSSAVGGLDQMEREYLSALKGERDTSVVS